jgi:hypothetical protein
MIVESSTVLHFLDFLFILLSNPHLIYTQMHHCYRQFPQSHLF